MDFQRFGIDPRLAQAAEGLPTGFFFFEKMLAHVVEAQENVCVKIALDGGREEVLLLPALQWILSGEGRRALVLVADEASGDRCAAAIGRLGSGAGLELCRVSHPEPEPGAEEGGAPRLQGDPGSAILMGRVEDLLALPELRLRDYGFLIADNLDLLVDVPTETIRRFCALLLPSWERRSVLACARFSNKVKNLAWDLADNPSELTIEGEVAKAQSVLKETWKVPGEAKIKFVLGLFAREKPLRVCVFCNLRDTVAEVTRRLSANGIGTDSILGSLSDERKFALIEKFRAGDCACLVLDDEGAVGLSPGVFPLIVNYDIPLEPELFVKRLEMLDRSDPGAKVVTLACDRYIVGLPAVEQYIDATLDPRPADESMLSAVDRSEGLGAERRPRSGAYQREPRRGQNQRREPEPREARPRDAGFRDGRNPDIRKSISEATGGALDVGGAIIPDSGFSRQAPGRQAQPRQTQHGAQRRGQGPSSEGRVPGKKDPRREEAVHRGGSPRGPDSDKAQPRQQQRQRRQAAQRQQPASPNPSREGATRRGTARPGNPYDMPMEERMRIYRERYGQGLDEKGSPTDGAKGKPGDAQRKGRSQGRPGAPSGRKPGPGPQGDGRQGPSRQGGRADGPVPAQPPEQRGNRPAGAPDASKGAGSLAERRSEGVVSRLLGALRKRKE